MGRYLGLGNASFQSVLKSGYVDKTGLIAYMNSVLGTKKKLACVSRARRFGKSLAAQMLCAYYDKSCDSRSLFQGLAIAGDPSFEQHLNKYPVIYIDVTTDMGLAGDIGQTVDFMRQQLLDELRSAYDCVSPAATHPIMALNDIHQATGEQFVMIIDEWDAICREAENRPELMKEYVLFLRTMFKGNLTDHVFAAVYMTGILPIKKYGTQSALNEFWEYSMTDPGPLAEYFGFTPAEVQTLCDSYGMDYEELRLWYDGYTLGQASSIFNPNSVIMAVTRHRCTSYWSKTERFDSLRKYIDMDFEGLQQAVVDMVNGGRRKVETITFGNDMGEVHDLDELLTLLIHLGYLTFDGEHETVRIPNQEIRHEFLLTLKKGRRKELSRLVADSDLLLQATLSQRGDYVAETFDRLHSQYTAPLFYNDEQALRALVRLAYISAIDSYIDIQELPTGKGYADLVFIPRRGSDLPALIVEMKYDQPASVAVQQIYDRRYSELVGEFADRLLLVGISYDRKLKTHECHIENYQSK